MRGEFMSHPLSSRAHSAARSRRRAGTYEDDRPVQFAITRPTKTCARCREKVNTLVTEFLICLPCVEYLVDQGGRWSAGDDVFAQASRDFVDESLRQQDKLRRQYAERESVTR